MVIYEVNLAIDRDIYTEFQSWLTEHIKEMLQFPGFMQATLLEQEADDAAEQGKLTIQYQLKSRGELDTYLIKSAPKMREEGIKRFKDKFSATRRIFKVQDILK